MPGPDTESTPCSCGGLDPRAEDATVPFLHGNTL